VDSGCAQQLLGLIAELESSDEVEVEVEDDAS